MYPARREVMPSFEVVMSPAEHRNMGISGLESRYFNKVAFMAISEESKSVIIKPAAM
jgi:hypothetical protein